MNELFLFPFTDFGFMRRALLACCVLSISAAPVGVMLMLRRMSLIGDAMSHAILPGVAVGFFTAGLSVGAMTLGGLIAGCLVAILAMLVARSTSTSEDGHMAAFYLISLSLGVLIISVAGTPADLMQVLFGSLLALDTSALYLLSAAATTTLFLFAAFYRTLVYECFDSTFMRLQGPWGVASQFVFLILVVVNLVAGFHALGTLLSVGLLILPAVCARFWVERLEHLLVVAILIAMICSVAGLLISFHFDVLSGPLIVFLLGLAYLLSVVFGFRQGIVQRLRKQPHLEA